jgi:hypothetical protein
VKYVCIFEKDNEEIKESHKKEIEILREYHLFHEEDLESIKKEIEEIQKSIKTCTEKTDFVDKELVRFRNEMMQYMNLYFSHLNAKINTGINSVREETMTSIQKESLTPPKENVEMKKEDNDAD